MLRALTTVRRALGASSVRYMVVRADMAMRTKLPWTSSTSPGPHLFRHCSFKQGPGLTYNSIPSCFQAGTDLRVRKVIQAVPPYIQPTTSDGWDPTLVKGATIKYSDDDKYSSLRLRRRAMLQWSTGGPSQVLLVKKPKSPPASQKLLEISAWLSQKGIKPLVEKVVHSTEFPQLDAYDSDKHEIDFCITLGGDGTVLHLASLFEADEPLPPVISFAMGTLGFLTPFDVTDFSLYLSRVMDSAKQPLFCTLRTRKRCEMRSKGQMVYVHNVLNEVVIDRGAFPGAVLLELFCDSHFVTNVEADGLIIATPSGSTAYSMSAGGPMVAPSVPCTILTPIAPLSLSFRPLVIPESSDIIINLPAYARSHARASFDGKKPLRMCRESSITVTTSLCPLPMINIGTLDSDWYEGITHKLKWNQSTRSLPKVPSYQAAVPSGSSANGNGNHLAGSVSSVVGSLSDPYTSGGGTTDNCSTGSFSEDCGEEYQDLYQEMTAKPKEQN